MQTGYLKRFLRNKIWGVISIFCSVLLIGIGISCHKSNGPEIITPPCPEFAFPPGIQIELKQNGKYISDSNYLSQLKLINGSIQKPVDDFHVSGGVQCADGLIHRFVTSVNAPLSSASGAKYYYMIYPDNTEDTIYLDIVRTPATNCLFVQNSILFNGLRPQTDTLLYINGDSTYVLNHP